MNLCIDLLPIADKLIVASNLSKGVCREIDFANLVGMEVEYLEPQYSRICRAIYASTENEQERQIFNAMLDKLNKR